MRDEAERSCEETVRVCGFTLCVVECSVFFHETPGLTMVYHSIIRGNSGRGIVKAKRSNNSERNTTLSTLIVIANLAIVATVDQRSGFGDL